MPESTPALGWDEEATIKVLRDAGLRAGDARRIARVAGPHREPVRIGGLVILFQPETEGRP